MRFLSAEAEISLKDLRCGDYAPQRGEALLSAATRLAEATLYIEDMDPLTPGLIRECLHKNYFGGQNSNELVIVDYFQLLRGDIAGKSVKEKLANNSMQLKFIAAEFNVPVVALSMLTRTNSPMEAVRTDRYARAVSRFADQIVVIRDSATI